MARDTYSNPDWETATDHRNDAWRWGALTYIMYEDDEPTSVEGYIVEEPIGNRQHANKIKVKCVTPHETIVVPWKRVCELVYTDDAPDAAQ